MEPSILIPKHTHTHTHTRKARPKTELNMVDKSRNWKMYEYSPSTVAAGIFAAPFCNTLIYSTYAVAHYARNAKRNEKFARMDQFKSEFELVPRRSVALRTKKMHTSTFLF